MGRALVQVLRLRQHQRPALARERPRAKSAGGCLQRSHQWRDNNHLKEPLTHSSGATRALHAVTSIASWHQESLRTKTHLGGLCLACA